VRARRIGTTLLVAVVCSLPGRGAHAQSSRVRVLSSLDVSGTAVTYADSIHATGASITPAFRIDWARATIGGSATYSQLSHSGSSAQASLAPSVFTPSAGPFTMEVAGAFGGSTHNDGSRTGQLLGLARVYAIGEGRGAWAGGGVGRTWDGVVWRGVRQGELGAWLTRGPATALATVTPVVVQDTIRYADIQAAVRYPRGRLELGLTGGVRAVATSPAIGGSSRAWGSISVVGWLSRQVALVGSAGSYPVDLTQGFPGGRFATIALRLASRNTRDADRETEAAGASSPAEHGALAFDVRSSGTSSRRTLRVFAPGAKSVEITGDFTQWQPAHLARGADGWWTVTRALAPGTYQMNMRVDGGPWIAPPGLLATRDEFGATTGILTIE
jgi:hypothetical protein